MMQITTPLACWSAAFLLGCGAAGASSPPMENAASPDASRPSAAPGAPSYGAVVVEAVENDGSEEGLEISDKLVIHFDEVRDALSKRTLS